jgi:hypothetical protein
LSNDFEICSDVLNTVEIPRFSQAFTISFIFSLLHFSRKILLKSWRLWKLPYLFFPKVKKGEGFFWCLKEGKRKLEGSTEIGGSFVKAFKQTRSVRLLLQGTPLTL